MILQAHPDVKKSRDRKQSYGHALFQSLSFCSVTALNEFLDSDSESLDSDSDLRPAKK